MGQREKLAEIADTGEDDLLDALADSSVDRATILLLLASTCFVGVVAIVVLPDLISTAVICNAHNRR